MLDDIVGEKRGDDGMNETERRLYNALRDIGLNPQAQYPVGRCVLDIAFPENAWDFEVNGRSHYTPEGREDDRKRMQFLHHTNPPWKVKSFHAQRVYDHPYTVAREIQRILQKDPRGGYGLGGKRPYRTWNHSDL